MKMEMKNEMRSIQATLIILLYGKEFMEIGEMWCNLWKYFLKILLTHEGSHREVYRNFQPSLTSSAGGAKGQSDHRFRAPPTYTAQLLTLHQHRANNHYKTANQIYPTLRVNSSTQAILEQSPIQELTKLNTRTGTYFQVDKPLCLKLLDRQTNGCNITVHRSTYNALQ